MTMALLGNLVAVLPNLKKKFFHVMALHDFENIYTNFRQQNETSFLQDLFIPGILINIWWKIGCLQHLIRSISREHNE